MALLLSSNNATLTDVASRLDPNGEIDVIAELLTQTNEVLSDMAFIEGNLPTGHKSTIRTGLPTAAWRMLNYGVPPSKSTTMQVVDTCGMLEAYAEVDKNLASLNNNTAAFRLSEDRSFLESMNIQMAETLFYGDTSKNPERFLGLSPRFSTVLKSKAKTAENVIDAGGTGADLTSIWLVSWGDQTVFGIYPKGSKAGFERQDLGEVTLIDSSGGKFQGYRTHYSWHTGLCVRDWRYIVRIANVPVTGLSAIQLVDLMVQAAEMLPNQNMGKLVWYMNKQVRTALRLEISNKSNVHLSMGEVGGKKVVTFDEIVVRRCDSLNNTETRVV